MIPTRIVTFGLRATAVMNLGAGLTSVIFPGLHARMMLADGVVLDGLTLRYHLMVWLFVATMGVGYALAARDPARQTGIIVAGGLGKLCAAALWTEMLASGFGTPFMIAGIAWDGALGVLLLLYALGPRRGPA